MKDRPYQSECVNRIFREWENARSTLAVMPTGTGKTVVMSRVIAHNTSSRSILVAHREELIWQAAQKIKAVAGIEPAIEMAEHKSDRGDGLFNRAAVVVASVASLMVSGRLEKFQPDEFGQLLIDEAHHATANSYRRIIAHFTQNKRCCVLGVTATPDRTDEEALGQIFQTVAYDYEILDAINDGWLAPINQRSVIVDGLDYSSVRTTAGDLNGADLARVLENETNLHQMASPTLELAGDRKTLVFTESVAQAEAFAEVLNRSKPGSARWVCGKTPKDARRKIFADYAQKQFQFLVNVGVATEGFDDPGIEVIVMGRPTKSRSLYAQMCGRGTRPLPGIVDPIPTAEGRREAIAASAKPACEIIDFVGNAGTHKLMSVADILGGNITRSVVAQAAKSAKEAGGAVNVGELLKEKQLEMWEQREIARAEEARRRMNIVARANYTTHSVNPFDVFQIQPAVERGWGRGKDITERQRALLERHYAGVDTSEMSYREKKQLLDELFARWDKNQCSFGEAKVLRKYGLDTDVSRTQAREWIDSIKANNWRLPADLAGAAAVVEVF